MFWRGLVERSPTLSHGMHAGFVKHACRNTLLQCTRQECARDHKTFQVLSHSVRLERRRSSPACGDMRPGHLRLWHFLKLSLRRTSVSSGAHASTWVPAASANLVGLFSSNRKTSHRGRRYFPWDLCLSPLLFASGGLRSVVCGQQIAFGLQVAQRSAVAASQATSALFQGTLCFAAAAVIGSTVMASWQPAHCIEDKLEPGKSGDMARPSAARSCHHACVWACLAAVFWHMQSIAACAQPGHYLGNTLPWADATDNSVAPYAGVHEERIQSSASTA